jgi:hypothetical protein
MSNRVSTSIRIGGKVRDLAALIEAIQAEDLRPDWNDPFDGKADILAHMQAGDETGVFFCRHEVSGGQLDDLLTECAKQGLAFRHEFDGYGGEWGPGRVICPAGGSPDEFSLNGDSGDIALTVREIAGVFSNIDDLLKYMRAAVEFETGALEIDAANIEAFEREGAE